MIQKKIVKQSHGSYQYITTEMRKKVIDLVLNLKMSIKDAASCVGIHPQTAKNFFIIYRQEGRIGKKQKRDKKKISPPYHSITITLDKDHLLNSKQSQPDWLFESYIQQSNEIIMPNFSRVDNQVELTKSNELSRIPVMGNFRNEQPISSQEPTQKIEQPCIINIKKEVGNDEEEKIQTLKQSLQNAQQQYLEFQNSSYAQKLIQNMALNPLIRMKQYNGFYNYQQLLNPQSFMQNSFTQR